MRSINPFPKSLSHRLALTLFGLIWLVSGLHAATPSQHQSEPQPGTQTYAPTWTVESETARIDLYGSIHLLPRDVEALSADAEKAYANADLLILEADIDSAAMGNAIVGMMLRAAYPAEHPGLREQLGAENFARLREMLGPLALPPRMLDRSQPWFAIMLLQQAVIMKAGAEPETGVEMVIMKRAKRDGLPIKFLETADFQLRLFTEMPHDDMLEALKKGLDSEEHGIDHGVETVKKLVTAWQRGDVSELERLVSESDEMTAALAERLLYARNRSWVDVIESLLRGNKRILMVVGTAHLVGAQSVIDELEKRGYRVTLNQRGLIVDSI